MALDQKLLEDLQALDGITINDPNTGTSVDSKSLINVKTSQNDLLLILPQLQDAPDNTTNTVIKLNNLGCIHALLKNYDIAKKYLQNALPAPTASQEQKQTVKKNLEIVKKLPLPPPPLLPSEIEILKRRRLVIEDNLEDG
jgi:hypothetical protein